MNVYEDKYLREKVNRIIARQKECETIIAAYKDGCGLASREDLGQELTRAAYPYDYAVGKAGFLNYDSELGAYLFTAKSGEKLPQVLANYRILTLGEAILDVKGPKYPYSMRRNQRHLHRSTTLERSVRSSERGQRRTGSSQFWDCCLEDCSEGKRGFQIG